MINKEDLYKQESIYLYDNRLWKILSYCPGPSVTMKCTTSRERMNFELGGVTEEAFKEIREVEK